MSIGPRKPGTEGPNGAMLGTGAEGTPPPRLRISIVRTPLMTLSVCLAAAACDMRGASNAANGTTSTGTSGQESAPSASTPGSGQVMGRALVQADKSQLLSWSGTTLSTRVTGVNLQVGLVLKSGQTQTFFRQFVDGADAGVLTITGTQSSYPVAGLSAGTHDVQLVKMNEGVDGTVLFTGFTAGAQTQLATPAAASTRRMLFIGDSITCGYGDLGEITAQVLASASAADASSRSCQALLKKSVYQLTDASASFGVKAAKTLKSDYQLLSWSGKGLYRNADNSTTDLVGSLFSRSVATDANSTADLSAYVPQVVFINVGTNDFAGATTTGGAPNIATFTNAYTALLSQIRAAYPDAFIYLATGPMLSDYYPTVFKALSTMRTTLQGIVTARADAKMAFLEFPVTLSSNTATSGCEYHPDAAQHTAMANLLVNAVRTQMGWNP